MKRTSMYAQKAADILRTICYATVATVSENGRPWNSPVSAVYDPDTLAVYWFSDKASQHSRNVRANGNVCMVFYDSTWPEGTGGQGLYMRARAEEVRHEAEIRHARYLKKGELGTDPAPFTGKSVRRVYKAVPEQAWVNDVQRENGVFIRDYRVRVALRDIRQQLKFGFSNLLQ